MNFKAILLIWVVVFILELLFPRKSKEEEDEYHFPPDDQNGMYDPVLAKHMGIERDSSSSFDDD